MPQRHGAAISFCFLLLVIGLTCPSCGDGRDAKQPAEADASAKKPEPGPLRLDGYTIRGFLFAYYLIPSGLSREELIAAAPALHDREPKAQLILVDDRSQLAAYINYAQESSRGNREAPFPQEWADRHVIANVQKYMSGKWMLCESYGYVEIAELK